MEDESNRKEAVRYVYIPGLGDRLNVFRRLLLRRWGDVELVPMRWSDTAETPEQKYLRVSAAIERLPQVPVVLIGESAGAAVALAILPRHADHIRGVVTVCGFNQGAEAILPYRRRRNPALYSISRDAELALRGLGLVERCKITTVYSVYDRVVAAGYSRINGAHEIVLHTPGHMVSIFYALLRVIDFAEFRHR